MPSKLATLMLVFGVPVDLAIIAWHVF